MRFLQATRIRSPRDVSAGPQLDVGLILKLLALAVCYALATDADAGDRAAMRLLATSASASITPAASPSAPANDAATQSSAPPSARYGDPQVLSALGEPLDVRIPLLGDDGAMAAEARYALGHADTRLGLPIVRNANIRVVKDAGGWALRVRSAIVNDEPALALVIQEKMASGTLSRVMPLLFDPAASIAPAEPALQQATHEPMHAPAAALAAVPAPAPTGANATALAATAAAFRQRLNPAARTTPRPLARVTVAVRRVPPAPSEERSTPLRLATTLAPAANPAAAHREAMRWLRRALLEEDDRASLLAMGRKVSQLVAQVEEMEARIATLQPPGATRTASTAGSAAPQPSRQSRRPG